MALKDTLRDAMQGGTGVQDLRNKMRTMNMQEKRNVLMERRRDLATKKADVAEAARLKLLGVQTKGAELDLAESEREAERRRALGEAYTPEMEAADLAKNREYEQMKNSPEWLKEQREQLKAGWAREEVMQGREDEAYQYGLETRMSPEQVEQGRKLNQDILRAQLAALRKSANWTKADDAMLNTTLRLGLNDARRKWALSKGFDPEALAQPDILTGMGGPGVPEVIDEGMTAGIAGPELTQTPELDEVIDYNERALEQYEGIFNNPEIPYKEKEPYLPKMLELKSKIAELKVARKPAVQNLKQEANNLMFKIESAQLLGTEADYEELAVEKQRIVSTLLAVGADDQARDVSKALDSALKDLRKEIIKGEKDRLDIPGYNEGGGNMSMEGWRKAGEQAGGGTVEEPLPGIKLQ